jgi:hypothetical protein
MNQPQLHPGPIHPGVRRTTSDSVYQVAIVVAALLLVISASLF